MKRFSIVMQVGDALSEAASRFTLILLPEKGHEIGTGACVSFKGINFVVTARHVVKDRDPGEIVFLRRPEVPLKFLDTMPDSLPPGKYLERGFSLFIDGVFASDSHDDLAALRLAGMPKELERMYFSKLDESSALPDEGQPVLVVGALRKLVRFGRMAGQPAGVVSLFIEGARIQGLASVPNDFDSSRHFAMWRVGTEGVSPPIDPKGLSGAGVWVAPKAEDGQIWDPSRLRLAGIQTGWYESQNMFKATRVERLVELMKGAS